MNLSDGRAGGADGSVAERLDALATWVNDIEARLRVSELATADEKTARELRKALEALSKHDPKLEKRVTDHVTVVTQRFDTLSSTVSATAAALAAREGEIAGLRREVEEAEKRLEELARRSGGGADAKEVARLRGIVDALSAQRPARTPDGRTDELGANVRMLAERVDSLTATVSANAAALGRRDKELATARERVDAGTQKVEFLAAELRRLERDDTFAVRIDALQVALVDANGAIADRAQEAEGLRARIDEAYSRTGDAVAELQRSVGDLTTQVDELRMLPHSAAAALDQRAATLDGRIDEVVARLETVAGEVGAGLAAIAQRDAQLAGLYRDVEAERARVDTLIGELRTVLDVLPDPAVGDALLGARLDEVERERADTAERLRRADENWLEERNWVRRQLERLAEAHEEVSRAAAAVDPTLGELRSGVDGLEAERHALAERLDAHEARQAELESRLGDAERDAAALEPAVGDLRAALDGLADERHSLVGSVDAHEARSVERHGQLEARLEEAERRAAAVVTELERSAAQGAAERTELDERFVRSVAALRAEAADRLGEVATDAAARMEAVDRLTGRLEALERRPDAAPDEGLLVQMQQLTVRLARVESAAQSAAAAAAVAAAASPEERLVEIRALVDGVLARMAAIEHEVESGAQDGGLAAVSAAVEGVVGRVAAVERQAATSVHDGDGLAELRSRLEDAVARVSAAEKSAAAAASGADSVRRVTEALAKRVEVAERMSAPLAGAAGDGGDQGDGRFRLELRALDLRMEHAESAARENREAVLMQLERLASRVEWRLQRLEEAVQAESSAEPEERGAQVVPIRGGADTP